MEKIRRQHLTNTPVKIAITVILTGLILGVIFLGVGGRFAMRIIAISTERTPTISFGGTITVLLAGGIAGGIISFISVVIKTFVNDIRIWRGLLYSLLITFSLILSIPDRSFLVSSLFGFLFIIYGIIFEIFLNRLMIRSNN